jgi:hypothetical protein
MKNNSKRILFLGLVAIMVMAAGCAKMFVTEIPTGPGLKSGSPNTVKLFVVTSQCRAALESVDGRAISNPPDAKDSKQYILEAGERSLVLKDTASGQVSRIIFTAQAKKKYMVKRYLGNFVSEENGLRTFCFSQDVGVGVYEFDGWIDPLVAFPQSPHGFARISEGQDAKAKILHLADQPLPEPDSAILHLGPNSSAYILAIMGEDQADPKTRYDYQGEYLRGDRSLPRQVNPLLGELPLLDYASFIRERSIRFRPGEYTLLCFYQSPPTRIKFTASKGGRFSFIANVDSKLFGKNTWNPRIEATQ